MEKEIGVDSTPTKVTLPLGSKIPVSRAGMKIGGNATHVAIGLARLGISTSLAAETGDDGVGLWMQNILQKENIDTTLLRLTPKSGASFAAILDVATDRTELTHHEVREHAFDLTQIAPSWIYLTSVGVEWHDLYHHVAQKISQEKIHLVCNPGSLQLAEGNKGLQEVLPLCDVLVVNKEEALLLATGQENFQFPISNFQKPKGPSTNNELPTTNNDTTKKDLANALLALGPRSVVITDGQNGSWFLNKTGDFYEEPSIHVEFTEKTGAGDGYVAGMLGALILGHPIQTALRWGALNSASCVANGGCSEGLMGLTAIEKAAIKQQEI